MNNYFDSVYNLTENNIPEAHTTHSFPTIKQNLYNFAKAIGISTLCALSTITAINDPWLMEKNQRDSTLTISVYQEIIGRYISRSEALEIAHQILIDAERERNEIAEFEADKGIQWEDRE